MELGRLPLDAVRVIAIYLDFGHLALLHASFDRLIQRLLCSAQVIDEVRIHPAKVVKYGAERYLIKSIREVDVVEFDKEANWSPNELSALATLNPRVLTLSSWLIDHSAVDLMSQLSKSPDSPDLREKTRYLTWLLWPNLSLLCPRLTHLTVSHGTDMRAICSRYVCPIENFGLERSAELLLLPTSLTSVTLQSMPVGDSTPFLLLLPATLRELSVSMLPYEADVVYRYIDLPVVISYFTAIERLEILLGSLKELKSPGRVPQTLTRLSLSYTLTIPLDLFQYIKLGDSNLETLCLNLGSPNGTSETYFMPEHLNGGVLPPTLRYLDIDHQKSSPILLGNSTGLSPIPPSITDLTITLHGLNDPILTAFPSMDFIRTLRLRALFPRGRTFQRRLQVVCQVEFDLGSLNPSPANLNVSALSLPPSLTELELSPDALAITPPAIDELPTSLQILRVRLFDLPQAHAFHGHLPDCHVYILEPIDIWSGLNGEHLRSGMFATFCEPVFDFQAWSSAVFAHFSALNIHFKICSSYETPSTGFLATNTLIAKTSPLNEYDTSADLFLKFRFPHHSLKAFPSLTQLIIDIPSLPTPLKLHGSAMPTLTHLDLGRTPHSNCITLPFDSLRFLAAKTAIELSGDYRTVSDTLTHVDAPLWSFLAENVVKWPLKEMAFMRCTIRDFADYGIVDFLTSAVSTETRANMAVAIEYNVTGSLLMDDDFSQRNLRYEEICDETSKILEQRLLAHMPIEPHLRSATLSKGVFEAVGRVVTSFKIQRDRGQGVPFCLPPSATFVSLNPGKPFSLASNIGQLRANIFRSKSPFGTSLSALDLELVDNVKGWWKFLPATLKHLRVHGTEVLSDWGVQNFPPNLETLVIISSVPPKSKANSTLTFSFSDLPSSLIKIAVIAPSLTLQTKDVESLAELSSLSRIALLMLVGASSHISARIYDRIPKASLHSLFIGHPKGTPPTTINSVASLVTSSLQKHPKMIYCYHNDQKLAAPLQQQLPYEEAMKLFDLQ